METVKESVQPFQENIIREISRKIYARQCPRNPRLVCAITTNTGGVTSAFKTIDYLAFHIYKKYGENWDRFRLRNLDNGRQANHGGKSHW